MNRRSPREQSATLFYILVALLVAALFAVLVSLEWWYAAAATAAGLGASLLALLRSDADEAGAQKRWLCSPEALANRQRAAKDAAAAAAGAAPSKYRW